MCGIYGFVGAARPCTALAEALVKLQYRGYDSAGIAYIKSNQIRCIKNAQSPAFLLSHKQIGALATCGIGHTRWATHGKPSKQNAHPFLDNSKSFALVHNGIIENYQVLKAELEKQGVLFTSETDSEVLVHLLASSTAETVQQTIMQVASKLQGSYATLFMCKDNDQRLYAFKNKSPLAIGFDGEYGVVASDSSVLDKHALYYFLRDNEFAIISKDKIELYDMSGKRLPIDLQLQKQSGEFEQNTEYDYNMQKEIAETPIKVEETRSSIVQEMLQYKKQLKQLKQKKRVFMVACGTAFHAGEVFAKQMLECGLIVMCVLASEFRYANYALNKHDACLFISQSGETADTIACLDYASSSKALTVALVNVAESTIARKANLVLHTRAGKEIGVASTKAFSCQLVALHCLALWLKYANNPNQFEHEIEAVKNASQNFLKQFDIVVKNPVLGQMAQTLQTSQSAYFIGRGIDYVLAKEGALKLKEISLIHAEGVASGELKHGSLSLVEQGFWTIIVLSQEATKEKALLAASEIKARNGNVLLISDQEVSSDYYDKIICIPKGQGYFAALYIAVVLQMLACEVTVQKKLSPDMPRNLAKSVTVE